MNSLFGFERLPFVVSVIVAVHIDEQAPHLAPQNATLRSIGHQKANKRLVWTIKALPAVSVAATMSNKSSCISIYHASKLSHSYVTSAISA